MLKIKHFSWIFSFVLVFVFSVVVFLRTYQLGSIPQGLTKDEAYYGYDAYSILQTERDIWGESFPLRFKSTGEYKLNLTYLIIPAISIFDLTERAVRTPSAFFGLLTLPILYLTLRAFSLSRYLSLFLTGLFALSPWAFGMSRLFYESNVGLFFIALGFYGYLRKHVHQTQFWSVVAPASLALAAYFYGPFLYIGLIILVTQIILHHRLGKSWIVYLLVLLPMLLSLGHGGGLTRLSQEWALKMPGYVMETDNARMNCYLSFDKNAQLAKLCYPFWNKPINQLEDLALVMLRTLSPEFLFFSGVNDYIVPNNSGAYLASFFPLYVCALLAISSIFKNRHKDQFKVIFLLVNLVLSVGIVSLAGRVELYRNPVGLYFIFILLALGAQWLIRYLKSWPKWIATITICLYLMVIVFDQFRYLLNYFTNYTRNNPLIFSSDSGEVYDYLLAHRDYRYLVDRKFHGPIYAAFYWKIDPDYFRDHVDWTNPDPWGWINAKSIDNIYSTEMTIEQLLCQKSRDPETPIKALVVSDPVPIYDKYASLSTYDASGVLRLHDIYDIDYLYTQLQIDDNCH